MPSPFEGIAELEGVIQEIRDAEALVEARLVALEGASGGGGTPEFTRYDVVFSGFTDGGHGDFPEFFTRINEKLGNGEGWVVHGPFIVRQPEGFYGLSFFQAVKAPAIPST